MRVYIPNITNWPIQWWCVCTCISSGCPCIPSLLSIMHGPSVVIRVGNMSKWSAKHTFKINFMPMGGGGRGGLVCLVVLECVVWCIHMRWIMCLENAFGGWIRFLRMNADSEWFEWCVCKTSGPLDGDETVFLFFIFYGSCFISWAQSRTSKVLKTLIPDSHVNARYDEHFTIGYHKKKVAMLPITSLFQSQPSMARPNPSWGSRYLPLTMSFLFQCKPMCMYTRVYVSYYEWWVWMGGD